jgi:hypothetical protein
VLTGTEEEEAHSTVASTVVVMAIVAETNALAQMRQAGIVRTVAQCLPLLAHHVQVVLER